MKKKEYLMTENVGSICIHDLEMDSVCDFWKDVEDRSEPFRLSEIALDALNTESKCGLLPSDLLNQRDELLEICKLLKMSGSFDYAKKNFGYSNAHWTVRLERAINQIEQ